uniref:Uncharacterized protein n=1 Tax=Oryza meridionalis TaxID=40149 RepID=A0A0E0EZW9_9ORYZ
MAQTTSPHHLDGLPSIPFLLLSSYLSLLLQAPWRHYGVCVEWITEAQADELTPFPLLLPVPTSGGSGARTDEFRVAKTVQSSATSSTMVVPPSLLIPSLIGHTILPSSHLSRPTASSDTYPTSPSSFLGSYGPIPSAAEQQQEHIPIHIAGELKGHGCGLRGVNMQIGQ